MHTASEKRILSPWCKAVRKAMIDKDMSIKELANVVNITPIYASKVTSGKTIPSHDLLCAICDLLDIRYPQNRSDLLSTIL